MATSAGEGEQRALARLAVQGGPDAGVRHPILKPVVSLGRGSQNDVVVEDDSVSTTHARLDYDAGAWRITDLASTNGTYVGGVRIPAEVPTPIPHGAGFRLGAVQLELATEAGADPDEARAAYVPPAPPQRIAERAVGFRIPVWLLALILLLLALAVLVFNLTRDEPAPQPAPVNTPAAIQTPPAPAPL